MSWVESKESNECIASFRFLSIQFNLLLPFDSVHSLLSPISINSIQLIHRFISIQFNSLIASFSLIELKEKEVINELNWNEVMNELNWIETGESNEWDETKGSDAFVTSFQFSSTHFITSFQFNSLKCFFPPEDVCKKSLFWWEKLKVKRKVQNKR